MVNGHPAHNHELCLTTPLKPVQDDMLRNASAHPPPERETQREGGGEKGGGRHKTPSHGGLPSLTHAQGREHALEL